MSCKKFCSSGKNRLIEDSELCSLSLEIFLRAHCLLKNFVDFFKFHACTCCSDINYDKIPLYGALDIVATAMTSVVCGKIPKEEFQRPGLFYNTPVCVQCQNVQDVPEEIVKKVDAILKCLQKSCAIENIICQVKDVIHSLEKSSDCSMSERFQNLSLCLKEIMKKLVCRGQPLEGPFYNKQMKLVLSLVNNFIRNWSEKRSGSSPSLKICRFCDSVISETTRQWGTFCCKNARQFHSIWKEWSLQQSISSMIAEESKWTQLQPKQFSEIDDASMICGIEQLPPRTPVPIGKCQTELRDKTSRRTDSAIKHRGAREEAEVSPKKTGTKGGRNIDGTGHPIGPDGRRKRDDEPPSRALRAAGGKTGKIRRGGKVRSVRSDSMEDEVPRSKRPGKNEKSDRSRSRRARRTGDDGQGDEDRSDKKSGKGKGRSLYRDALDGDGNGTDRRRRKKSRKGDTEFDDDTVESEKKRVSGGRRKHKGRLSEERDESDSEVTKKRKSAKIGSPGTEDKSTLDSEKRSKKETSALGKKGRKGADSNGMDDDYSKKSGSRSHKRKSGASRQYDVGTDNRHPIEYQLSNQHFVELGWTVLPVAKTIKKLVQYRTKPAKPHLDWFKKLGYNSQVYYGDGPDIFLKFHENGSGQVFYPNGKLAIDICSPGGKDFTGVERKSQIVALFDTMGNGSVFDEDGEIRLSYNQIGGIWRDNPTGLQLTWMWDIDQKESIIKAVYTEKSAEHLEKYFQQPTKPVLKSSGSTKASVSAASSRSKEKKVAKQKPVVVEHQEEEAVGSGDDSHHKFSKDGCHFKPICMKLNDFISFRILNRSNINLQFSAGRKNIRIELGTILDLDREVTSYFVDSIPKTAMLRGRYERLLSPKLQRDDSLYNVAKELRNVKKSARQRRFMMNKYRPSWYAWKKAGTRCRPR